ncbi:MAG: 30S ribosome-binding factor RbfA [Anaerolineales bacterium]
MPSQARARRLGDRIQEELAEILRREVADPRLTLVTITDVEVDRDFSYATVFLTTAEADRSREEILGAFDRAAGFLRRELAARIPLRVFPRLRFRWDASPDQAARIEDLLAGLHRKGDRREGKPREG